MSQNEQHSVSEKEKKRPKLFQKIVTLFVGVPALVTTLTYGEYRYQYNDPIQRGVNISELFKRIYATGDAKASFMDMIADSNYDTVTKSWLIGVANDYKDALELGGVKELQAAVEKGVAPTLQKISEIISTVDDENRKIAIFVETAKEKSNETLLSLIESTQFDEKLQAIIDSQKPEMSLVDVRDQNDKIYGFASSTDLETMQELQPLVSHFEESLQQPLVSILVRAKITLMITNGEHRSFDQDSLSTFVNTVEKYVQTNGLEATHFLLNALEFQGVGSNCLPESINTTFDNIAKLYSILKAKDEKGLDFILKKASVQPEYVGVYYAFLINLDNAKWDEKISAEYHDLFTHIAGGDVQLGSVLFIDYLLKVRGWETEPVPESMGEFKRYLENLQAVQMIRKYNLSYREVIFYLDIFGPISTIWHEETIQEFRKDPKKLKLPRNYFYVGNENEKLKLAYDQILSRFPDSLSMNAKTAIYYLVQEAIARVTIRYSKEQLAQIFQTEVKSVGDVQLMPIENNFSLSDSEKQTERKIMVDVPLIFQGAQDSFLAFDEERSTFTPNLASLTATELVSVLSDFHFLYKRDGVLQFGSVATILSTLSSFNTVSELIDSLRQANISAFTRVLPVKWDEEHISPEGHTSRINSDEFTGVVVIVDEAGVVRSQMLIMIPPYQLLEINREELRKTLNLKTGEALQLLVPDAGFATTFSTTSTEKEILSWGGDQNILQGIRFVID